MTGRPSKDEVIAVLRRFVVREHYQASTQARVRRYAVFESGHQLTSPCDHRQAQLQREQLTAQQLLDMFEGAS